MPKRIRRRLGNRVPEARTPKGCGDEQQKIVKLIKKQSVDERGNDDSRHSATRSARSQDQWPGQPGQPGHAARTCQPGQSQFNGKQAGRGDGKNIKKVQSQWRRLDGPASWPCVLKWSQAKYALMCVGSAFARVALEVGPA